MQHRSSCSLLRYLVTEIGAVALFCLPQGRIDAGKECLLSVYCSLCPRGRQTRGNPSYSHATVKVAPTKEIALSPSARCVVRWGHMITVCWHRFSEAEEKIISDVYIRYDIHTS